jgi:hypothetical protein
MPAPIINGITHNATEPVGPGDTFEVAIDAEGATDIVFTATVANAQNESATGDITIAGKATLAYALTAAIPMHVNPKPGEPGTFIVTVP